MDNHSHLQAENKVMHEKLQNPLQQLRQQIKELRLQMPKSDRDRSSLIMRGRLFTWLETNRTALRDAGKSDDIHIAAFWPTAHEPELQPLLRKWSSESGLRISLPVVQDHSQPLAWRNWSIGTEMTAGAFNIQEPQGPDLQATDVPDVVLVPTLGFTRQGDRLGYGGGFYDRTLAAWQQAGHKFTTVGIAWACGDLSNKNYTAAEHDYKLDSILTDKGWAVAATSLSK